jgi:O-acetylserine/cysteine efflux transporter
MTRISARDLTFLVSICLIWGFNLIAISAGLKAFPPVFFAFLRFAVLALALAPLLRLHRRQMGPLIVAAVLSGGLNFGLLFYGMSLTDNVAAVAIASQLGLPFTTLLSVALLGEVVRWRRWLGVAMSFAGVMLMGFDPGVFTQGAALLWVSASAFVGALGLIAVKRVIGIRPVELQAWFAMASWPVLLSMTLMVETGQIQAVQNAGALAWMAVAYVALLSSLVGHTGYYFLIQRYPVSSVAPVTVLSPLFSVMFSITLLRTPLTPRLIAGGTVTLLGVLIIAAREKKIVDTGS